MTQKGCEYKMIRIESNCCDCGLPCLHAACSHYEYIIYECDDCGEENKLYWLDGKQLCIGCIAEHLEEVYYNE